MSNQIMNITLQTKLFDEILPLVNKPARYVGNEFNSVHKDSSTIAFKIALAFPDVYEIGMSHLGMKIFYEMINQIPDLVAERVYSPWLDMETLMREKDIPLFSLESYLPVNQFDLFAITLQHELCYSSVLNMLDLGRIPVFNKDRSDTDPIVIAGGHTTGNPEPMAPFIDVFVIGDGEKAFLEIIESLKSTKGKFNRRERLIKLAVIEGVYLPEFYSPVYDDQGKLLATKPLIPDVPAMVHARWEDLESCPYPLHQIVPNIETTHDRIALEIQRGCTRGCRFCQAGYLTRPRRERSVAILVQQAVESIRNTGQSEIALLSLSSSDYHDIDELLHQIANQFESGKVSLSMPSMRLDSFSIDLAKSIQRVKKNNFTFAVEAGSERLRNVINKTITNEDLIKVMVEVFQAGWMTAKLYFMIGLPTETYDDLQAMVDLMETAAMTARQHSRRGAVINVAISVFVPKPHSPFQFTPQLSMEEIQARIYWVRDRVKARNLKIKWHDPVQSYLEAILARGDRRMAQVIYQAWKQGANLENWSAQFNLNRWKTAFETVGLNPDDYATRQYQLDEFLPWSHIQSGISQEFLKQEYLKAMDELTTPDCSTSPGCSICGVKDCTHQKLQNKIPLPQPRVQETPESEAVIKPKELEVKNPAYRFKFKKNEIISFISHLDLMGTFSYAIRRADLPIAYSQGFNPQMIFQLALPISLGHISEAEYGQFSLREPVSPEVVLSRLRATLPEGIELLDVWQMGDNTPGFAKIIQSVQYQVSGIPDTVDLGKLKERIAGFLASTEILHQRVRETSTKTINLRQYVTRLELVLNPAPVLRVELLISPSGNARIEEIMEYLLGDEVKSIKLMKYRRMGLFSNLDGHSVSLDTTARPAL